jgi:hypothetical protein
MSSAAATPAHDVLTDRVGAEAMAALHHRLEHTDRALGQRVEIAAGTQVSLDRVGEDRVAIVGRPCEPAPDRRAPATAPHGEHPRAAERPALRDGIRRCRSGAAVASRADIPHCATIGAQTVGDELDVAAKLARVLVAFGRAS